MKSTTPIQLRVSRFLADRYAYRTEPDYLPELIALGIVALTAIWPIVLLANTMAAAK